ncbi:MAG: DUF1700 domain-containing protein [Halanaerobiales bacterium]|nr:DUF1700 domain-containing protein [Halanaerobiales bacterium]
MKKNDFLKELSQHLLGIPDDEIKDILYDFREYFNAGLQDGRSEEELTDSLGDPKALAKQVKTEYMVKLAKKTPNLRNMFNAILATMGLGFFKTIGLFLIIIGVSILVNYFSIIDLTWGKIWPIFIIGLGAAFQASYFTNPLRSKTNESFLIPGAILTITGLLFLFLVFTDFIYIAKLWPIFILSIAIGLFQFYYFGSRNFWILIPTVILTVFSSIFLVRNLSNIQFFSFFLACVFIIGGLVVWFNIGKRNY